MSAIELKTKISAWLNDKNNNENDLLDFLIDECGIDYYPEEEQEVPPSPPITEDSFYFNTKCVCSKEGENDYPCMCDIHEEEEEGDFCGCSKCLAEEEEVIISDLDKKCEDCDNIVENFYLNNPFGNGNRNCSECEINE